MVQGNVSAPGGDPIAGAEVLHAATGTPLGVTDEVGSFRVEGPDPDAADFVLEFRHPGTIPVVRRVACDGSLNVRLAPRVFELETVTIRADRLDPAYEASSIREESLGGLVDLRDAEGGGVSLAQALQQLPGVGAIGRDGLTSAPTIRGMGRDRSLILVEGVRMSSDRGVGPTASFLDPFLLEEVSVVRGAAGVSYGSGAIGGVIATGLGAPGEELRGSLRVAGITNGAGRLVAGKVSGVELGPWFGTAGAFLRAHDDYEFPKAGSVAAGDATNSGFENAGGMFAAERDAAGGRLRVAALGTSAEEIGRPTTNSQRLDTIEVEEHWLGSVRWQRNETRRRTEFSAGYHLPRTINRTERFRDDGTASRTGRITNDSHDGSLSVLLERPHRSGSWLAGGDFFTRWGVNAVEVNRLDPGTPAETTESTQLVANARRADTGAFAGYKRTIHHLGEAIVAGRLDWVHRAADGQESTSELSPSVQAGLVRPINEQWAVTSALGRSFRAPRIQELYFEGDRPGGSRLANPDLKPETAWSLESGVRWARPPFAADANLWGILANDLIVQLPVDAAGDTLIHRNESQGRLVGTEIEVRWRPENGRSHASLGYAFIYGENEDGDPLPDIPSGEFRIAGETRVYGDDVRNAAVRLSMRAGGAKTPLGLGTEAKWWSGVLGASDLGGDEAPHPGFARWDAGVRVQWTPRASLDVSATNLFDSQYLDRPENDAFPQPGRSLRVELTLSS